MKKIYYLFSVVALFVCESQNLFASDTLFVVTDKGNYLFDVSTQRLIPFNENSSLNILFSTEGLDYFVQAPDVNIEYSYQKRKEYTWWSINLFTKKEQYELVNFDTKPENSGYILYPLSWNSDYSSLYFLSTNNDALGNEKGIYEYNVRKKKLFQRISPFSYHKVPLVNSSKTACYFLRTDEHGQSIVSFDFKSHKEKVLVSGLSISRLGIVNHSLSVNYLPLCVIDLNQPEMKSPFKPLVSFCITRMGFDNVLYCDNACEYTTPLCSALPYCEGHCESGCVSCRDAVDMDVTNPSFSTKTIVASSDGYVIRAQNSCPVSGMGQGYGFGYHVVIRHGDQNDTNTPETLYAHLDMVFVDEGEFVFAGQHIGVLGNSQALDCNGDGVLDCDCESDTNEHLHYEYHDGTAGLYSPMDIFAPVFQDIGECVPQPNNSYTTNFLGLNQENIYPSAEVSIQSIDIDCGASVAFVTLVGQSCDCCEAQWSYGDQEFSGDTLVFPVTQAMVSLPYINLSRNVYSPCVSAISSSEMPGIIVLNDNYFSECFPGCNDINACNYESWATHDDGSCHYLCVSECELIDLNHDGIVTTQDLVNLLTLVGSAGPLGDFNQDGNVGVSDMVIMFSFFGEICD